MTAANSVPGGIQLALFCSLLLMAVRALHVAALYRTRPEGVLDGVPAERFLQPGDRAMVTQRLAVADRLAVGSREPRERADVETFRARSDTRSLLAPRPA
jgi:hypothetical protein